MELRAGETREFWQERKVARVRVAVGVVREEPTPEIVRMQSCWDLERDWPRALGRGGQAGKVRLPGLWAVGGKAVIFTKTRYRGSFRRMDRGSSGRQENLAICLPEGSHDHTEKRQPQTVEHFTKCFLPGTPGAPRSSTKVRIAASLFQR